MPARACCPAHPTPALLTPPHLPGLLQRCALITGPNMGGKSCLIRTAALLVIMAQVGD
jgi:dsDNA-specific endonuclease/ATPase MutS2